MPKVAYLLAAFPGPRLNGDIPAYAEDYTLFLRHHIKMLELYEHNCDVYIIINEPSTYRPNVREYLEELSSKYTVWRRPNIGCSYGAWDHAFRQIPDYDYYILMEDDYVPVQDNFDTKLVNLIEQHQSAYLCTMIGWGCGGGTLPHAAISNGIVNGNVVRNVLARGGFRFSDRHIDIGTDGRAGQVTFSQDFLSGGAITDFTDVYKAPFWHVDRLVNYGDWAPEVLLAPYQWDMS